MTLTEIMLHLKAIDKTLTSEIREKGIVYGGIITKNSGVGASALRAEPFILEEFVLTD